MKPAVLIVDDEPLIREALRHRLSDVGHRVFEASDGAEALHFIDEDMDVVILDGRLPDMDGVALLKKFREADPDLPVILMTAYSSIENGVQAMREGAYHYVTKPFAIEDMVKAVAGALQTTELRRQVKALRAYRSDAYSFDRIIGDSEAMRSVRSVLAKVAQSPAATVLLSSESGTGKDLIAKTIHFNSSRASKPFMNVTCSALPEALLESELFGHERGSFTDAKDQRRGLFEQANGGTLFLDEIAEMKPSLQAKLLHFLEERKLRRVGGSGEISVDVRVIAATNKKLEDCVREGSFRSDLYYRLSVVVVKVPPLRERIEDIAPLVNLYVERFGREFKKNIRSISPEAMHQLEAHSWPGNVRELKNSVERAVILCDGDVLTPHDFRFIAPWTPVSNAFALPPSGVDFEQLERDLVRQALERTAGNQTRAAELLGINRDQIRYRIEKFGLQRARSVSNIYTID